jgi:hypothetical protein
LDVSKVYRVLHLFSPPSAASSLPMLTRHPYDAVAGSFQIGGAARPSPLVTRAARTPRGARNGVQRADIHPGASTTVDGDAYGSHRHDQPRGREAVLCARRSGNTARRGNR